MPGILGAIDESLPLTAVAALVRAMAARLRVQPGLKVESDLADPRVARRLDPQAAAEFALFQCVLLDRTLIGRRAPAAARVAPRLRAGTRRTPARHVGGPLSAALGVGLTLELLARAFLDPQEQERLGLDELDQVQLRDAAGWLVCTEKVAPAPVAVHATPVDTLIPGRSAQGPE